MNDDINFKGKSYTIPMEITVLPSDDPKKLRLNWCIYEEMGCEIFKASKGWAKILRELMPCYGYVTEALEKRYAIRGLKGIKIGGSIVVGHLFGWEEVKVTEVDYQKKTGMAESETAVFPLEWTKRRGWVNTCMINKNCLENPCLKIDDKK
jgi:hypothetical protein